MKKLCTLVLLLIGVGITLNAQVHINEYSAANLANFFDNYERTEDWIELYNDGDVDVDLSGYHLSDKASKPGKWEIPSGTIIPAKGFLVFWCSGRDEVCDNNHFHTNFKLAQTKDNETLLFTMPDESIIDEIPLGLVLVESSWCRSTDGGEDWLICTNPSLGSSNNETNQYERYTMIPSMDMPAGYYTDSVLVTLTNNDPGTTLRYTMDGTNPTADSPEYMEPILIKETTVLKAQSFSNDPMVLDGKMDFNTYFINEDFTLAVFSVAADRVQDLANGEGSLIPIGSIEYFNTDKEREATSFGSLNRHGQDSWALDHRSLDWVSRDEMGYSKAVNAPLFSFSDRDEYQKFMFRNSGDDNYPAINDFNHQGSTHIRDEYVQTLAREGGLKLDSRSVERVILFLNGTYWGVYGMRDRPVDHDYTDYYYDQGKYDVQYLTTWGDTELQYGGQQALNDWYRLRNFILENDMGDTSNYEKVTDELNVVSLMDYMIVNLNCVASDWLNYNTGWWRGTNPDGDHKKWGYILWDLDATFDYYINYSGVPNISPDAQPCDIEDISNFMDEFFDMNEGEAGPGSIICTTTGDFASCNSIMNGSSPYEASDSLFMIVVNQDNSCCEDWDETCQAQYDELNVSPEDFANCPSILDGSCPHELDDPYLLQVFQATDNCCENWFGYCNFYYNFFANGGEAGSDVDGNVGMHEKIFLKLQEESEVFRQLYYSRQADLMNTVYTCENMIATLDRMLAVIEPEMPRQIERWGGSMGQWQANVQRLKNFINQRCELFDEGLTNCFDLTGPYELTLLVEPDGVGEIDLNTLDIEDFPWTGDYFGGMVNKIKARAFEDDFQFSHWETKAGSMIMPSLTDRKATIQLESQDTLIAVFESVVGVEDLASGISMNVFPNPSSGVASIRYELEEPMEVQISILNMMGQVVKQLPTSGTKTSAGVHNQQIDLTKEGISTGVYLIRLKADNYEITKRLSVLR
ncbi:MAG: CotH kinase family protein [Saprospiraceae bacterium]|nr:CotH kinase family protein [Saprospiraceae bacterium]